MPADDARTPLVVTANVNNFGNISTTRIKEDGPNTTFNTYSDLLGLTILDKEGNVLCNNLPYSYGYDGWIFDNQNTDGKTAPYYDSKAYTYIAYFPYTREADGITTIEELTNKFKPHTDQRKEDAYRASDLLVWSHTGGPLKPVNITFTHAYALLYFTPRVEINTEAGKIPLSVNSDEVNVTIDGTTRWPYKEIFNNSSTGNYRLIIAANDHLSFRWFFNWQDDVKSGTVNEFKLSANQRYVHTTTAPIGDYKIADNDATLGDFYCKSADGTAYLIPSCAPMLTAEEKASCIGIVYKTGNPIDNTDGDALLQAEHPGCSHGWVVALKDVGNDGSPATDANFIWSSSSEDIEAWAQQNYSNYPIGSIRAQDKRYGFGNTKVLLTYNQSIGESSNKVVVPVATIDIFRTNHVIPPISSSNWYFPSIQEMIDVHNQRGLLGSQFAKCNLGSFGIYFWWSSTENNQSTAQAMNFLSSNNGHLSKSDNISRVRAVLAF